MRKSIRFLLPLLLLCTLLVSMAVPSFADRINIGGDDTTLVLEDSVTGTVTQLDFDYILGYTGMVTYDGNLLITMPFVAELIVDILYGLIAAFVLFYILWKVQILKGAVLDKALAPCETYFFAPLVANVKNACNKLCKNTNKLQAGFYWAILSLGGLHCIARLVLNLLYCGSFSFAGVVLLPLTVLFVLFLIMGNGAFLQFKVGNFLSILLATGILTYLGFSLYASFTTTAEITLISWAIRVSAMALSLFLIGVLANQWVPQSIGSTLLQAGGVLFVIFQGAQTLIRAYTIPGAIFSDLYLLAIPVLLYFVFADIRYTSAPKVAAVAEDAETDTADEEAVEAEPAEETVEEEAVVETAEAEEAVVEEPLAEEPAEEVYEELPAEEEAAPAEDSDATEE